MAKGVLCSQGFSLFKPVIAKNNHQMARPPTVASEIKMMSMNCISNVQLISWNHIDDCDQQISLIRTSCQII